MVRGPGRALRRALQRALPWWWLVVVMAVVGGLAGHVLAPRVQTYRATTTMLVGVPTNDAFVQPDDLAASANLARVLVEMVSQQRVLGGVTSKLGLDTSWRQLRANVVANVAGQSNRLIVVSATARSAAEATSVVGAIPGQLAAAAFPDAPPSDARAFLWSRLKAVRRHIYASQHQVDVLERQHAAAPRDARISRRLDDARALVNRLDGSLASLYRELERATSADRLKMIDAPSIVARPPFPSEAWLDLALAVMGALTAIVFANVWSLRAQRRVAGGAVPAYAA